MRGPLRHLVPWAQLLAIVGAFVALINDNHRTAETLLIVSAVLQLAWFTWLRPAPTTSSRTERDARLLR